MSLDLRGLDPRRVTRADVYVGRRWAATLDRLPSGVEFRYTEDHLIGAGTPVASTLPLVRDPVVTMAGAVPPFFAGLLPEGRRLNALRQAVKTSADDDLSLLIAVGSDTVGDAQIVPHADSPTMPSPLVTVTKAWDEIEFSRVLDAAGIVDPVALAGIQHKASAGMISLPLARAGERFILKVDPPEYPHVVLNEAYMLRQAHAAGLPVVDAEVVHDATGRPGLLIRRFDRLPRPDGTTHPLHVEDGAQVLGRYPADKYAVSFEDVASALTNLCAARPVAARDLYRQACFAWLTGNGDLHAKNLSVLVDPSGEWRVAPAYDIPCTLPYGDHILALSVDGRVHGLSRRRLLALGADLGLREAAATTILDRLLVATSTIADDWAAGSLPFSDKVCRDVARVMRQRHRTASG